MVTEGTRAASSTRSPNAVRKDTRSIRAIARSSESPAASPTAPMNAGSSYEPRRSAGSARARLPGAPGEGLLANEAPSRLCGGIRVRGLSEDAGVVADHDVLLGRDVRRQLHKYVGSGRSARPEA